METWDLGCAVFCPDFLGAGWHYDGTHEQDDTAGCKAWAVIYF